MRFSSLGEHGARQTMSRGKAQVLDAAGVPQDAPTHRADAER